jgi:hypothetical protein
MLMEQPSPGLVTLVQHLMLEIRQLNEEARNEAQRRLHKHKHRTEGA